MEHLAPTQERLDTTMNMKAILKAAWFTPVRTQVTFSSVNAAEALAAKSKQDPAEKPTPKVSWGLTLLVWDKPGTGKTSIIKQQSLATGLGHAEVLSPGMRGEGAFGVVPVPDLERGVLTYPPPEWAWLFLHKADARGVCFLDEVNTAPPALQPALLGLALDGTIGACVLPGGIRRIAAANPIEDAAGGWDLPPALANRFGHIAWEAPDVSSWVEWLVGECDEDGTVLDADKEEARVLREWNRPWATARGLVSGFLTRRPELLHKQPALGDANLSRAWPSRRSWESATRALASAEVHGLSPTDTDELVSAFVGTAAAAELQTYRDESDLPDPEALLDGKVSWKHDSRRLDRTLAVLSACSALIRKEDAPRRKERATVLWKLLGPIASDAPDLTVPTGRILCKARLSAMPEARPVLARIQPMLAQAGISST